MCQQLVEFAQNRLRALADPAKAGPMQAYMKTTDPFYGVQSAPRKKIVSELKKRFPLKNNAEYKKAVLALWNLPHREEKYLALGLARRHDEYVTYDNLPLYKNLIQQGAWWDLVDEASHLVGRALAKNREQMFAEMDKWINAQDVWVRRVAIICQLKLREQTDQERLFRYCLMNCSDTEFFIQKAIGWALRQYSYAKPEAVKTFLISNKDRLANLSYREGAKRLIREGLL